MSIIEKLSVKSFSVIGHRGVAGRAPENTLRGVEYAVSVGVDVVEIDVRATRDEMIIILHDPDFKRASGLNIVARSVDCEWVKENIHIRMEPAPVLGDLLEPVKSSGVGLFIEVKEPDTTIVY